MLFLVSSFKGILMISFCVYEHSFARTKLCTDFNVGYTVCERNIGMSTEDKISFISFYISGRYTIITISYEFFLLSFTR